MKRRRKPHEDPKSWRFSPGVGDERVKKFKAEYNDGSLLTKIKKFWRDKTEGGTT